MGIYALAKLRKGISVSQAEIEMRQIAAQLEKEYPAVNTGHGVLTQSLQASVVLEVRSTLLVLMGAVGFVLLIACVNVANLSLARSLVRQQEMGIRMALGAGRGRLIRQLLSETLVEGGVFHVDDDALDLLIRDQFSEFIGFLLRRQCTDRDVPRAIGQDNEKRLDIGVMSLFLAQHIRGEEQTCGERSLAPYGDVHEGALGELDGIGGG